jgi:hypothetical protein
MTFFKAVRQIRRSIGGLGPVGISDYLMPAIGILAVGMLAGAGVALLFAPTSGKKLREEMEHKISGLRSRLMLPQGDGAHAAGGNNIAEQAEAVPRNG